MDSFDLSSLPSEPTFLQEGNITFSEIFKLLKEDPPKATKRITIEIKDHVQKIGACTEIIKSKFDLISARTIQYTDGIN